MADAIDRLAKRLEGSKQWPPKKEAKERENLKLYKALRETDRERLKQHVGWDEDRDYVVDPLPERIPGCWADMIYGEAPIFTAAKPEDQDALDNLIEAGAVPDELQEAVKIASSEKEAWWRIIVDQALEYPVIEWRSPIDVYTEMAGHQLVAVAFVERLDSPSSETDDNAVWRYVEYQEKGRIVHRLYRASGGGGGETDQAEQRLGRQVDLVDHPETEDFEEEWNHGLSVMLAGVVRNGRGDRPAVGRSDYAGPLDLLLQLNEATTIGGENMRLSGKKRAVVSSKVLDEDGNFPAGTDVFIRHDTDTGDDGDKSEGLVQVEWTFEAGPLIEWTEKLEDTALTRARVAPQLIGRFTEGAQTGPALRARLLDSILAATGKARAWEAEVPNALVAAQLVDQLPEEQGGFGHEWNAAAEAPGQERKDSLPVDATEQAQRIIQELSAEIISRRTAIEERHPDWSPNRVDQEMKQLAEDVEASEARRPPGPFEDPADEG